MKRKPQLRTIGINNICYDKSNKKKYSIQFYDYDNKHLDHLEYIRMAPVELKAILEIFPNDLILYRTKHGIHFISFTLLKGIYISKANVLQVTKLLNESQDYFPYQKELTLRVSGKWGKKRFSKKRKTISKKPKFARLLKLPNKDNIISKTHLDFYFKWMGLPKEIYNLYKKCEMRNYDITISHYKTRD